MAIPRDITATIGPLGGNDDIWVDDDGVWLQYESWTHGPFATTSEAERRAALIADGVSCACEECRP